MASCSGTRTLLVLALAVLWGPHASAARELFAQCSNEFAKSQNYGEDPVSDHQQTCDKAPNTDCWGQGEGCSLWQSAQERCKEIHQKARCDADHHYIYEGSTQQNHVILVPTIPTRGIEDIQANDFNARTQTAALWEHFWQDSVNYDSGGDGKSGFDPATGALVINPPWFREYHQMHIHGGTRNKDFNACVARMTYSQRWQWLHCTPLTRGGGANQANLYYKTVTGLGGVWDAYIKGLAQSSLQKNTPIPAQDLKYHVGVAVTRSTALRSDQYFVILYAPVSSADKLGRGSFLNGS